MKAETLKLTLHTSFTLTYFENTQRLVMALTMAGFYVRVAHRVEGSDYTILVYTDR